MIELPLWFVQPGPVHGHQPDVQHVARPPCARPLHRRWTTPARIAREAPSIIPALSSGGLPDALEGGEHHVEGHDCHPPGALHHSEPNIILGPVPVPQAFQFFALLTVTPVALTWILTILAAITIGKASWNLIYTSH